MGNTNSHERISDDEDLPSYNYHEQVLHEAHSIAVGINRDHPSCVSDDEQFFSAEEGDSVGSITPPRTRAESPSGDDFSDHSDNSDEEGESLVNPNDTGNISLSAQEFLAPASVGGSPERLKSCGRCNVSVFQEHDSIGPELEMARRRSNQSFSESGRSTRQSVRLNPNLRSQDSLPPLSPSQSCESVPRPSPFKPIILSSGKRKVGVNVNEVDDPILQKKMKTVNRTNSSKRTRLGYFESSQSESDGEDSGKKSSKKRKVVEKDKGYKRKGSISDISEDNFSDSRYRRRSSRKRRRRRKSSSTSEDSDESVVDRKRRHRKTTVSGKKHRRESSCEDSEAGRRKKSRSDSDRTHHSPSGDRATRQSRRRPHSDENLGNTDLFEHKNLPDKESPCKISKWQGEHETRLSSEVGLSDKVKAFETKASNFQRNTSDSLKMGDQAIRNIYGKILPLRSQHSEMSLATSNSRDVLVNPVSQQQLFSGLSKFQDGANNLTSRPSAFTRSNLVSDSLNKANFERNSVFNTFSQLKASQSDGAHCKALDTDESLATTEENIHRSPFQNVVLTPSSQNVSQNNSNSVNQGLKRGMNFDDDASEMEVEVDISSNNNNLSQNASDSLAPPHGYDFDSCGFDQNRKVLRGKRLRRSAAERFKTFWSQKKNIGSSLRSFFSKSKPSPSTNSDVAHSGTKPECVNPKTKQSPDVAASSTFGLQQGILWTSSPIQGTQLSLGSRSLDSSPGNNSLPTCRQLPFSSRQLSPIASTNSVGTRKLRSGTNQSGMSTKSNQSMNSQTLGHGPTQSSHVRINFHTNRPNAVGQRTESLDSNMSVELLPQTSLYQVLHFQLALLIEVSVTMGCLAEQTTSGLVNWTDGALTHSTTECSSNVAAKAGALMRAGCNDFLENKGSQLVAPDVLTTPAGGRFDTRVESILHVVAPQKSEKEEEDKIALVEVYANCLRFADERLGLNSISFPLIGQGMFPDKMCIQAFYDALLIFLAEHSNSPPSLGLVHLVLSNAAITDLTADFLHSCLDSTSSQGLELAVTETFNRYCGQNRLTAVQNLENSPGAEKRSPSSQDLSPNLDRAISGRPRLKRPRL